MHTVFSETSNHSQRKMWLIIIVLYAGRETDEEVDNNNRSIYIYMCTHASHNKHFTVLYTSITIALGLGIENRIWIGTETNFSFFPESFKS